MPITPAPAAAKSELVLAIETSCDETAAAVVRGDGTILSNVIFSQIAIHQPWSGVVPDLAARAHLDQIDLVVAQAMRESGVEPSALTAIAATVGPGLVGGLLIGSQFGKTLAYAWNKPFCPINHLEAHALSPRLTPPNQPRIPFPYLLLLTSGGHCQLLLVRGVGDYERWGTTLDDAVGEAFDKSARLLGLPYPGGPAIEAAAVGGNPNAYRLPQPLSRPPNQPNSPENFDFSFSGLKTAMRRLTQELGAEVVQQPQVVADLAASFQATVAQFLARRAQQAAARFMKHYQTERQAAGQQTGLEEGRATPDDQPYLVMAGGVAANQTIRQAVTAAAAKHGMRFHAPPMVLCTDNAAMVGWAALERLIVGKSWPANQVVRPRWPLSELGDSGRTAATA
jgi:N6-L-threonylcarbamoyladenine synthase